jgi:hypothetical protein
MDGWMDGWMDGRWNVEKKLERYGHRSWMGWSPKLNGTVTVSGQKRKIYCNDDFNNTYDLTLH